MAVRSKEDKTIAILPDAAAGVDQDVIAYKRKLNGATRADVAIPADPDIGTDHGTGPDDRPGADFDVRADHSQRIDNDVILQVRRRIANSAGCDTGAAQPGLASTGV